MSAIPGLDFVEMDLNQEKAFCCGAGGGRMWMEEEGERVNHMRTDQFLETGADTLAVSCPFCIQMFDEGITAKGVEDGKQAVDLITILNQATE
jgi:Fe-S oxidoreductase